MKSGTSIGDAAKQLWRFYRGLQGFKSQHYEFALILRILDGPLAHEDFLFYLKVRATQCKRLLVKSQLGDSPDLVAFNLEKMVVAIQDWVPVLSQVFAGTYSPTASVQRLSQRLIDTEYTDEIPASVLLKCCMCEFEEAKTKKKDVLKVTQPHRGHKAKCQSLDQLFYRNPDRLFESTLPVSSSITKKSVPPSNFSLMNFGKHPFQESKPKVRDSLKPANNLFYDEELAQASVDDTPEPRLKPDHSPIQFNGFRGSMTIESDPAIVAENQQMKEEIAKLSNEQQRSQAAVEELMSFCQRVSTQHDMLLAQNSKIKRLLSLVTDKLIRLDPKLIKDIDFAEVINDPCREFKPLGGASEAEEQSIDEEISVKDMPFSVSAGRQMKRKFAPPDCISESPID